MKKWWLGCLLLGFCLQGCVPAYMGRLYSMRGRVYQVQVSSTILKGKVGETVSGEVLLLAIPPYKIQLQYPHIMIHFKHDAVELLNPKLTKKNHKGISPTRWTLTPRFRLQKVGEFTVKGRFHFGMCSETDCYPRTVELAWKIKVTRADSTPTPPLKRPLPPLSK